jgi:ParB family chromosome partitioning protein
MTTATLQEFQFVPLAQLVPGPDHRKHTDRKAFDDLVASVQQHGVLEPLLVRPIDGKFEVVAGRRRLAAAKVAKVENVPVRVKVLTDDEATEVSIVENLQREDVHPLDEADGYARLLHRAGRIDDVAARVGKSVPYVAARLSLTRLIPAWREPYEKGLLEFSGARALARLSETGQKRLRGEYRSLREAISTERLEDLIRRDIMLDLSGAPWKKDDAELVPAAGACAVCPKRTGAVPALFPEFTKGDHCTDPACFEAKMIMHINRALAADPTIVLLSDGWSRGMDEKPWAGKKLLTLDRYGSGDAKEAKQGSCEHVVPGIIVTGERCGQRVHVCANLRTVPSCKVHGRQVSAQSAQARAGQAKARQEREIEQRTLAAIAEAVRKVAAKHKEPDWLDPGDIRSLAMFVTMRAEQNVERALCKLFEIEPDKRGGYGAFDAGMKKWIKGSPVGDVTAFVITAAAAADLLTLRWRGGQANDTTRALAIRYGVNLDAVAQEVAAEFKARAKVRQKKTSKVRAEASARRKTGRARARKTAEKP